MIKTCVQTDGDADVERVTGICDPILFLVSDPMRRHDRGGDFLRGVTHGLGTRWLALGMDGCHERIPSDQDGPFLFPEDKDDPDPGLE